MDSTLIIALVVFASVAALVVFLYQGGKKADIAQKARLAASRPGRGKIVEVTALGATQGPKKDPLVKVEIRVTPAEGAPYAATTAWFVSVVAMPRVQPGQDVAVLIDAEDATVVYPAEPWAQYGWAFARLLLPRR